MSEKAKILFVDDERRVLTSLRATFRSDYQVFLANSGLEALEIIRKEQICAIISDQRMPGMLGHELLRKVKQVSPGTMRLLLTGYSDLKAVASSINDGEVFRYIHKPWDIDEIRSTIASAVQIAGDTMSQLNTSALVKNDDVPATVPEADIMVLDDDAAVFSQVRNLFPPSLIVHTARNIDHALAILEQEKIAVLVTDVTAAGQDTTDFVKLLKQQHPLVMTIILTESIDAESAIELINQGQIYRYLRRPVGDSILQLSIQHGIHFYTKNKLDPKLLLRQKVTSTEVRNPTLAEKITRRLQSIRKRFRFI